MPVQIAELYEIYEQYPSVETDTRKIEKGSLFFALKGANFNGNAFALQALEKGAAYAIVDEPIDPSNDRLILVPDVLTCLQDLARYHREQFQIPVIAITGSNGKTTTKELVSAVLSSHLKTATTEGNLNNHIGIPLTILKIKKDAEIAVIEMGANHQKEIASYCLYTQPTHGIITNCGKAHLEGFGSEEGVRIGKGELFDYLSAQNGTAFVLTDAPYLIDMSKAIQKRFAYGSKVGNLVGAVAASETFLSVAISKGIDPVTIHTQLVGDYNLPNVLCALAVGLYFQIPDNKMVEAIENYSPSNSRSQLLQVGTNHFILDAYNANPSSMQLAIENFAKLSVPNKVLMLGAMKELGTNSVEEHQTIANLIEKYSFKNVVLVGGDFEKITHPFIYLPNANAAKEWLQAKGFTDTYILVKGSRGIQMEKILAQ
jgi:UDP-N-acetylmuramoyl-tripeptide--D-alanyl-D-alanine ligase